MTYDSQGRRILHSHPSTWAQEVEQLQEKVTELAMLVLAAEGQAEEAYQAQLKAQEETRWQMIRAQQAIDEAKALRERVATLEAALGKIVILCHTYPGIADGAGEIARAALQQETKP
jgi:chromosome segregation ATPase